MSHRIRHDRRSIRAAWLRLVAALAVMLLAVLPHATLAAGAGHPAAATVSPHADPGRHSVAAASEKPCHEGVGHEGRAHEGLTHEGSGHEAGRPAPVGHGAMPSCCVLGCGLIASFADPTQQLIPAHWDSMPPERAEPGDGLRPEPAERPPRAPRLA